MPRNSRLQRLPGPILKNKPDSAGPINRQSFQGKDCVKIYERENHVINDYLAALPETRIPLCSRLIIFLAGNERIVTSRRNG